MIKVSYEMVGRYTMRLDAATTTTYEDGGADGDRVRAEVKRDARIIAGQVGGPVDVESHDGVTLEHVRA